MSKWKQGTYTLKHPEKYLGKENPKYKSGLEERCFYYFDTNINILSWCYEPFPIPYFKPIIENNQIHMEERKYYVDFIATIKDTSGTIKKYMIEVKSKSETMPPVQPKKMTQKNKTRLMNEQLTFAVNQAKWQAASKFALAHDMNFIHLTDDMIR